MQKHGLAWGNTWIIARGRIEPHLQVRKAERTNGDWGAQPAKDQQNEKTIRFGGERPVQIALLGRLREKRPKLKTGSYTGFVESIYQHKGKPAARRYARNDTTVCRSKESWGPTAGGSGKKH